MYECLCIHKFYLNMCFIYIYISLSWLEFEFKVGINISQLSLIFPGFSLVKKLMCHGGAEGIF